MAQRVEEWALTDPRLSLADFIREVGLPVWGITPVAYRLADGLTILVRAVVIFEVP